MKPWCGSLSQWSNGLLIHGLSGSHGTIREERLRRFYYAAQREGFRGGKAARNGLCSVCNVLYVFCLACVHVDINMHESVHLQYTHLLVFNCTFSLRQRQVEGNTGQLQLTQLSHFPFGIWFSCILSGKLRGSTLIIQSAVAADKPWYACNLPFRLVHPSLRGGNVSRFL